MRVVNVNTHAIGTIEYIKDGYVAIDFHGDISKYAYPSSFAKMFELEDEILQEQIQTEQCVCHNTYWSKYYQSQGWWTEDTKKISSIFGRCKGK